MRFSLQNETENFLSIIFPGQIEIPSCLKVFCTNFLCQKYSRNETHTLLGAILRFTNLYFQKSGTIVHADDETDN